VFCLYIAYYLCMFQVIKDREKIIRNIERRARILAKRGLVAKWCANSEACLPHSVCRLLPFLFE